MDARFGDWVTYNKSYRRSERKVTHKEPYRVDYMRFWDTSHLKEPIRALYIGTRTLANGTVDWSEDEGNYFKATEHIQAALVCRNARANPIYVPIDCLQVLI